MEVNPSWRIMLRYTFRVALTSEQLLALYRGEAQRFSVMSEQGLRIELPIHHLRRFVSHGGIHGRFRLTTDENHRFIDLERLA